MNILLVDDSMLIRSMLRSLIDSFPGFSVVGEAGNGKKGIEAARQLKPDLILMDIRMPEVDGIEATAAIMAEHPVPIIILTSEDVAEAGYQALTAGAVEVLSKPPIDMMNSPEFRSQIQELLTQAARFPVINAPVADTSALPAKPAQSDVAILAIGASTGGPSAVKTVLRDLPADFPVPVILTQHIEAGFDGGYAEWLDGDCPLQVALARDGELLVPGRVFVAPGDRHLTCGGGRIRLDDGPRFDNQKPSVDVMFTSVAAEFGSRSLAVLLTGMGRDGAKGCLEIFQSGGITVAQDKASSMIWGMPGAAVELGAASFTLNLGQIAGFICRRLGVDVA